MDPHRGQFSVTEDLRTLPGSQTGLFRAPQVA
jgi:hypothetical protein